MKIGRNKLRQILLEEACGCMAAEPEVDYLHSVDSDSYYAPAGEHHELNTSVDKDSVLSCVAVLAMSVSCPVTREALLSTVYDLMT